MFHQATALSILQRWVRDARTEGEKEAGREGGRQGGANCSCTRPLSDVTCAILKRRPLEFKSNLICFSSSRHQQLLTQCNLRFVECFSAHKDSNKEKNRNSSVVPCKYLICSGTGGARGWGGPLENQVNVELEKKTTSPCFTQRGRFVQAYTHAQYIYIYVYVHIY